MHHQTFFKPQNRSKNKYGAKRTEFNGYKYDSKFEASVAADLELRVAGKDIKSFDRQYKIEVWAHTKSGKPVFKVSHKVDFRIHHNDGSYELFEAKGLETTDYRWRKKFVELWLLDHPDHTYSVVKQASYGSRRF